MFQNGPAGLDIFHQQALNRAAIDEANSCWGDDLLMMLPCMTALHVRVHAVASFKTSGLYSEALTAASFVATVIQVCQ